MEQLGVALSSRPLIEYVETAASETADVAEALMDADEFMHVRLA